MDIIDWEKTYNNTVNTIKQEAAKMSADCETGACSSLPIGLKEGCILACQGKVSTAEGLNLAAAYTTYAAGLVALGTGLEAAQIECDKLTPCAASR